MDIEKVRDFGKQIDFGRAAQDYIRHRIGFPERFFETLSRLGIGIKNQRILDLGTGTGTIALGLARAGANVIGLDTSEKLLNEARNAAAEKELEINFIAGDATSLQFEPETFDVVTAGQCWHWFNRPVVAQEVLRVLKCRGHIVIAHFDWLPYRGTVVAHTEELIKRYNPMWTLGGRTGIYPEWLADLAMSGFVDIETFSFDHTVPYTHDGWRGRMRASSGIRASLSEELVGRFDQDLSLLLKRNFPSENLLIPHRVWAVIGIKPHRKTGQ